MENLKEAASKRQRLLDELSQFETLYNRSEIGYKFQSEDVTVNKSSDLMSSNEQLLIQKYVLAIQKCGEDMKPKVLEHNNELFMLRLELQIDDKVGEIVKAAVASKEAEMRKLLNDKEAEFQKILATKQAE